MSDSINLFLQEQALLKEYKKTEPDLMVPRRNFSYQEVLRQIGIDIDFGFLPQGYLNLYHQDFIVEEIASDGKLSTIEPGISEVSTQPNPTEKILHADLVKVGLSTLEARESLAKALELNPEDIGYAGIKDKVAITSQRISIRTADQSRFADLHVPALFLKNFSWGKGAIRKGNLAGNQFIIIIRTPTTLGQGWLNQALGSVKDGFYNFYYLQRFGSPRFLSHQLGKLILQQNYRETVEIFFTAKGIQDVPLLTQLRSQVKENFGHWQKVEEIFLKLPYTFRLELEIVTYLKAHSEDFLGALQKVLDQSTLWVYAYASYLFNGNLSELINDKKRLPKDIPLLLNSAYSHVPFYIEKLKQDKINNLVEALGSFFGQPRMNEKNFIRAKVPVKVIKAKIINNAVIIAFRLPVAVYATTFLTHLFSLYQGRPIPGWLDQTKYDSKKILGLGSVAQTEELLGEYIFNPLETDW